MAKKKAEPAGVGHNSDGANIDVLNETAQGQLKSVVERIERLNSEKDEISEEIKEVYAEAKGDGFDTAVLRRVVRFRALDRAREEERMAIMDLYLVALGEV